MSRVRYEQLLAFMKFKQKHYNLYRKTLSCHGKKETEGGRCGGGALDHLEGDCYNWGWLEELPLVCLENPWGAVSGNIPQESLEAGGLSEVIVVRTAWRPLGLPLTISFNNLLKMRPSMSSSKWTALELKPNCRGVFHPPTHDNRSRRHNHFLVGGRLHLGIKIGLVALSPSSPTAIDSSLSSSSLKETFPSVSPKESSSRLEGSLTKQRCKVATCLRLQALGSSLGDWS